MIGQLTGILLEKHAPNLLLNVNGVAYELEASLHTFAKLAEVGQQACLYTHLQVREDAFLLYGFYSLSERVLFRDLIKVNGIGPKLALAMLSHITPEELTHCVIEKDTTRLTQIPGIGKKTAERLLIEMKDRIVNWPIHTEMSAASASAAFKQNSATQEAVSALQALGYKPQEAQQVVARVAKEGETSSEALIRLALKAMAKS